MWPFKRKKEKEPILPPTVTPTVQTRSHNSGNLMKEPVLRPTATPTDTGRKVTVTDGISVFDRCQDLLNDLNNRILPYLDRSTQSDIAFFYLTAGTASARMSGPKRNVLDSSLGEFKVALNQMITKINNDFPIQKWEVRVNNHSVVVFAYEGGESVFVTMFTIDTENRVYGL